MHNRMTRFVGGALCALLLGPLSGCSLHTHDFRQTVVPPTCNGIGYTVNTCACGEVTYSDYLPATAHTFGDWQAERPATLTEGGEEYRVCQVCGILQNRDVLPLSALPRLSLDGAPDGTLTFRYTDGETDLTTGASQADGLNDLLLELDEPLDLGWGAQTRCLLTDGGSDATFARDATAGTLWSDCLSARTDLPDWESDVLPAEALRNGVKPVLLYRDGSFERLALLSLPLADRLDGAVFQATDESDGCLFLGAPTFSDLRAGNGTDVNGFALLRATDESVEPAKERFEAFQSFVLQSRDAVFRERLADFTDPDTLIDYFLLLQTLGNPYGVTLGTVWYTPDLEHFLPAFPAFRAGLGLRSNGTLTDGSDAVSTGQNLLWERLCALFPEEIATRYQALRGTLLREDALCERFRTQYETVEPGLLDPEEAETSGDPDRVEAFLRRRVAVLDAWTASLLPQEE